MTPEVQDVQNAQRTTTGQEAQTPPTPLIPTAPLTPRVSTTPLAAPISQSPFTAHAARRQGWNQLLRILGVLLAVVGGLTLGYFAPTMSFGSDVILWAFVLGLVVWAALIAVLFQSFWAVLVVPAISLLGLFVGSSVQLFGFDIGAWFTSGFGDVDIVVITIIVPWMVGAFIGTPLGMWVKQRLRS